MDTEAGTLKVGSVETALTSRIANGKVEVTFGAGWEAEMKCAEFTKIVEDADEKLQRGRPPTKGIGKGKRAKPE